MLSTSTGLQTADLFVKLSSQNFWANEIKEVMLCLFDVKGCRQIPLDYEAGKN